MVVIELQNPVWLSECWRSKVETGRQENLSPLSEPSTYWLLQYAAIISAVCCTEPCSPKLLQANTCQGKLFKKHHTYAGWEPTKGHEVNKEIRKKKICLLLKMISIYFTFL